MDVEEFKKKYEELKDNPMYKNFCSILDTKNQVLERMSKENQELTKKLEQCSAVAETNSELADSIDEHYKKQQKEFIEWLKNESAELIRDSGYHRRICLDILEKYKEIIGGSNDQ